MADAAASAEAAIAADPEGVWPTIAMSYRRAHEGKLDEAVALAQKAVAAGGGAAATGALAHAQAAKGDLAAAEASYRRRWRADPVAIGPVVGLATVLRETGRAAEAEPMLKKVIDSSPGAVEAYKEMARVKIALGRSQEALADANLAAAMAENDPEAQALVVEVKVARALQDVGAGQTDLAVQDLTQLRDQNPNSAAVRLGLGRAQIARRDADARPRRAAEGGRARPEERRGPVPARLRAAGHEAEPGRRRRPLREGGRGGAGQRDVPDEPRQRAPRGGADRARRRGADEGDVQPRATPARRPGSTWAPRSSRRAASRRPCPRSRSPSPRSPTTPRPRPTSPGRTSGSRTPRSSRRTARKARKLG